MRRLRLLLGSLLTIAACGTGEAIRPTDPTYAGAMGLNVCGGPLAPAAPLVVDWRPEERASLEVAVRRGVAVVRYDCRTLTVLPFCNAPGSYQFTGFTRKEQVVRLSNRDQIEANLPVHGVQLAGSLARGTSLDIGLMMVGQRGTSLQTVTRDGLQGSCDGATHFVQSATLGAFAMTTGAAAEARTAAEIFGAGTSASSLSSKTVLNRDGDLVACGTAGPSSSDAPAQCGALVRLQLVPVVGGNAPPGSVFGGSCAHRSASNAGDSCYEWFASDANEARARQSYMHAGCTAMPLGRSSEGVRCASGAVYGCRSANMIRWTYRTNNEPAAAPFCGVDQVVYP